MISLASLDLANARIAEAHREAERRRNRRLHARRRASDISSSKPLELDTTPEGAQMNTTTTHPTRPAPRKRLPGSRRTGFALAAAGGLIAIAGATTTEAFANLLPGDSVSGPGLPAGDDSSQQCRLYESDAASWGRTGAHLPPGCSEGE